jgi:phage terminase large subunit
MGVKKEPNSVKAQIDYLKGVKIYIHPSCTHTIQEIQQWKWKKDKQTGLHIDEPLDFMDDAMAALRYFVEEKRRNMKGKLKAAKSIY